MENMKDKSPCYHYWIWLNMPKMCLNKQNSEYASSFSMLNFSEYGKVLNKAGFSKCKRYTAYWICQNMPWYCYEYTLSSKYARILNMQDLHQVLNMSQYGWTTRDMPEYIWIFNNRQGSEYVSVRGHSKS